MGLAVAAQAAQNLPTRETRAHESRDQSCAVLSLIFLYDCGAAKRVASVDRVKRPSRLYTFTIVSPSMYLTRGFNLMVKAYSSSIMVLPGSSLWMTLACV